MVILMGYALIAKPVFSQVAINPTTATTEDLLRATAAQQIINSGEMTVGKYFSLSPEMRAMIPPDVVQRMFQQSEARRQAAIQKQQAAQAAVVAAWNKSWQDAADHADETHEKALRYNIDLALKGDDYGEYRMGQRCRDGEGIPKDLKKAREWFGKSAAQGNISAIKELAHLLADFPELRTTNNAPAEIKPPTVITNIVILTNK